MKTSISLSLAAILLAALLASATAQNASDQTTTDNNSTNEPDQAAPPPDAPPADVAMPDVPPDAPPMPMEDNAANDTTAPANGAQPVFSKRTTAVASTAPADSVPSAFVPPQAAGTNADALLLNFRNAPLDMVLNYLSDAAGFIIVLDTPVHGNVSVISSHPMTRDEAVDLLNSVLNKNGYAAIRDGRTLTIVDKDDAKTRDIPVKVSNDPDTIPKNAEIVTQIIPIRFVEARQLVSDLSSFVSPQATIVANEEGNSIVITDTQSNIRHLAEIIKAVDSSAEAETEIRVFHLRYANPTDVANLLGGIFPSSSSGSGTQSPIRFGGGGGAGGGGPGGFFARMMAAQGGAAGGGSGSSQNQRVQKAQQVIAVADLRTSSVVVTAAKDLMEEIDGMIRELDVNSSRDQKVYVFHVDNADPQQALQVLQTMFPSTSTSSSRSSSSSSSQNSALMTREQNNATSTGTSSSSSSSTSSGIGGGGGRTGGGGGGLF